MDSDLRPAADPVGLLEQMATRLDDARRLTDDVRAALMRGDEETILGAERRLGTLLLEYRLLAEEFGRQLGGETDYRDTPQLAEARTKLERAATRIARSAAIGSGTLIRLVDRTRTLLQLLDPDRGAAYLPSGRGAEPSGTGIRLQRRA